MKTLSWQDRLWKKKVERKKERTHRPCATHRTARKVCDECGRVVCADCGHVCQPRRIPELEPDPPKRRRKQDIPRRRESDPKGPVPDPSVESVWTIIEPLGALGIEAHLDSGQWAMVFPANHWDLTSVKDLADRVWLNAALRMLAHPTPFRAGKWQRPERWWVSFQMRSQNSAPNGTAAPP